MDYWRDNNLKNKTMPQYFIEQYRYKGENEQDREQFFADIMEIEFLEQELKLSESHNLLTVCIFKIILKKKP